MAHNALLPAGRTRPIPAYIGVRDNGPFGNSARVVAVTPANRTDQLTAASGQGVGSALLGGPNGGTTLKLVGGL